MNGVKKGRIVAWGTLTDCGMRMRCICTTSTDPGSVRNVFEACSMVELQNIVSSGVIVVLHEFLLELLKEFLLQFFRGAFQKIL